MKWFRILAILVVSLALAACSIEDTPPKETPPAPEEPAPAPTPEDPEDPAPEDPDPEDPEDETLITSEFQGSGRYDVTGTATITGRNGQLTLSFAENFSSSSGPDLFVWLVKDESDLSSALELGELSATAGAQSYTLPNDTDIEDYSHIYIWCKQFSQLFGSASLAD